MFDELHHHFYTQTPLTGSFIQKLNELDLVLSPIIKDQRRQDLFALRKAFVGAGLAEKEADKMAEDAQKTQQDIGF